MAQRLLIVVLFVLAVVTASSLTVLYLQNKGTSTNGVSADQLGKAIGEYLEHNPEVVIKSLKNAQAKQQQQEAQQAEGSVKEVLPKIQAMKPMSGDENAPVTFAVFHDYNCGFCRKSVEDVIKVAEQNKNTKVVLIDFPILGQGSTDKAKASVAVSLIAPDKLYAFFKEVESKNAQNTEQILEIASSLGIDKDQLQEEIKSDRVENRLNENRSIGEQVGVQGTPAFIINEQIIKGAMGYDAFKAAIDKAAKI